MNAQEVMKSDSTKSDTIAKKENIKISFGKTKIIIVQEEDDKDDEFQISINDTVAKKKPKQRTNHFAGVDLGVNGFLSSNNSVDLQTDAQFLELNYGTKSLEVAINVWEKFIPIAEEKFGIVTGLGLKYNNYDIAKDIVIVDIMDSTFGIVDSTRAIYKNKFKTTMIHVPLMFETNLGRDADHSFHLAVGGIVGYRIGSKTKQKYKQDGDREKKKDRGDFNINPFQFAATARVGYGDFTLYASYNLTPLFDKNKGPEIYPFTVGLSLVSF
jgi:hypothetical protein